MESEHMGYFNGKKVPFAKNQSFKQVVLNPYEDNESVITVQIVGDRIDMSSEAQDD